jgi:23S rRNA (guanosine2251-2'-O)-methyltransferase
VREERVWIWGRHPVAEAARAGRLRTVLIASGLKPSAVLDEIRQAASGPGVRLREVSREEIERIVPGQNAQGVAAEVVEQRMDTVGELLASLPQSGSEPILLVLDQLQDPQNAGSLLRTAEAAGVHGVLLPERRSASLAGAAARVSAGAVSYLQVVEVVNLARALDEVREAGIWVIGLDGSAAQTLFSVDLTVPLALVVGNEGTGLRRLTRQSCDYLVRLPMFGRVESLNAAAAGSIALYEVVRQRQTVR